MALLGQHRLSAFIPLLKLNSFNQGQFHLNGIIWTASPMRRLAFLQVTLGNMHTGRYFNNIGGIFSEMHCWCTNTGVPPYLWGFHSGLFPPIMWTIETGKCLPLPSRAEGSSAHLASGGFTEDSIDHGHPSTVSAGFILSNKAEKVTETVIFLMPYKALW